MKKFLILLLFVPFLLQAQLPVFSPNGGDGYDSAVKTFTATDTTFTATIYWTEENRMLSGACTLFGYQDLTAGTDTITTFSYRQIMRSSSAIDGNVIYDTTAARTISASAGDYIPAENDITSAGQPFYISLSDQDAWGPSVGVELTFAVGTGNTGMQKRIEAYLNFTVNAVR